VRNGISFFSHHTEIFVCFCSIVNQAIVKSSSLSSLLAVKELCACVTGGAI
jgi:hypothetical protein